MPQIYPVLTRLAQLGTAFLCLLPPLIYAAADPEQVVNDILKLEQEPPGVIFEIVTGKDAGLEWALPMTKDYIRRLRQRFPDLHVAIVTHGREQFALQKKQQGENSKVHSLTQQLNKEGIALHVCGTYAGRRGLTAEDFPEYVNVSETGPAQVIDYLALEYILVKITRQR